jgi:hypothetical protein
LGLLWDFGADFSPDGIEKHGSVNQIDSKSYKKILIQNVWEIRGHVFDDSAKQTEEFF